MAKKALTKVEKQAVSARNRAKNATAKLREITSPMGRAASVPFTIAGGAAVGTLRGLGYGEFMGAPTDVVAAVGLFAAGLGLGSPQMVDAAGGAGAVAAARYIEDMVAKQSAGGN